MCGIVGFTNYNGNMSGLLQADGSLNSAIGTDIPSNTATVTFKPKAMESVGHGGSGDNVTGTIGHHTFTAGKKTDEKTTISYEFQADSSSWLNRNSASNTLMQEKFEIILPSLIQRTGIIKKCAFAV